MMVFKQRGILYSVEQQQWNKNNNKKENSYQIKERPAVNISKVSSNIFQNKNHLEL